MFKMTTEYLFRESLRVWNDEGIAVIVPVNPGICVRCVDHPIQFVQERRQGAFDLEWPEEWPVGRRGKCIASSSLNWDCNVLRLAIVVVVVDDDGVVVCIVLIRHKI